MHNSIVIMEVGPGLIAIPVDCKIMSIVSKNMHAHWKAPQGVMSLSSW